MARKVYSKTERGKNGYGCSDLIELIDNRIASAGDVALYTFTDYQSGVRTVIMPEEFRQQYRAIGTWLSENGFCRSHIGIMADNSYEWILTMWAIICSNNVLVALDKSLEEETTSKMLDFSDTTLLFYSAAYEKKARSLEEKLGIRIYPLENYRELVETGTALMAEGKDGCTRQKLDENAPALFMFTSGTTGNNKCVMLSQRNIISNTVCTREQMSLNYDIVYLLPLHHILGLNVAHLPYIISGKTIHINRSMRDMFRDIQTENPEMLIGVPMFAEIYYKLVWNHIKSSGLEEKVRAMLEQNRSKPELTARERREMFRDAISVLGDRLVGVITGGSPIESKYYDGFREFGIELIEGYGITECSPIISVNFIGGNKPGSVGRILLDCEVRIDQPNDRGEGEICVKGPNVMLGYYKDEKATADAIRDGWFHTGDIGYIDDDDYLYICGRIKNLIILSNGENVSPEELEAKIVECPAVKEVVVYDKGGRIAAQVFVDPEYTPEAPDSDPKEEVRLFMEKLNQGLAAFKQIMVTEFREVPFERNASKKIIRSSVIDQ